MKIKLFSKYKKRVINISLKSRENATNIWFSVKNWFSVEVLSLVGKGIGHKNKTKSLLWFAITLNLKSL